MKRLRLPKTLPPASPLAAGPRATSVRRRQPRLQFLVRPLMFAAVIGCITGAAPPSMRSITSIALAQAPTSLMGTWVSGDPQDTSGPLTVVVFFDQANYLFMCQGADVPGGKDGFELGTYSWDPASHVFQVLHLTADTDGDSGFSKLHGTATIHVDGNHLTFMDSQDSVSGTRLDAQAAHPLVGSWYTTDTDRCCTLALVTFLDDTHFLLMQHGGDSNGQDGIERGTYTWNPSTKAFVPTVDPDTDTNGEYGFSSIDGTRCIDVSVSGDTLTYSDCHGSGLPLSRVPNAALATATPTAIPSATPTPTMPVPLLVTGSCQQPGPQGLVNCTAGTTVTVSRCNNSSCDPTNLTLLDTTEVGGDGSFSFTLASAEAGGVRLLFTAAIAAGGADRRGVQAQTAPLGFPVIALGPAGAGAHLDNVHIDPATEAATQLLAQQGLENYTDSAVMQVLAQGSAANAGNTFAGQTNNAAVATAVQTDQSDPDFLTALGDTRPFCLGDCNDDGQLTINELITLVNVALDPKKLVACVPGNGNADLEIKVNEIIAAVNAALSGCPK